MATKLAQAYVEIVPSMKGVGNAITKAFGDASESVGKSEGQKLGGGMSSGLSAKFGVISGVAQNVAGKVIDAFQGLSGEITSASDSAQKFAGTLGFAGVSTDQIKALTASTQEYADKTVYDLNDIRNTTAQLAANGVPNYDKLAEAAGNLNAVAGGNSDTFKSVAMVLTQTAGAGKLTTENWNQLADAIPGASGKLQEAMLKNGAYTGNFRDAMANGEITADEFNKAIMDLGMTDVAKEAATSTQTIEGAMGNLEAAAVKAGMSFLDVVKPAVTGGMSVAADAISDFATKATGALQAVVDYARTGDFTSELAEAFNMEEDSPLFDAMASLRETIVDTFTRGRQAVSDFVAGFSQTGAAQGFFDMLGKAAEYLVTWWNSLVSVGASLAESFSNLVSSGSGLEGLGRTIGDAFSAAMDAVGWVLDKLTGLSDWASEHADVVSSALVGIGVGLAVFKIGSLITTVVTALQGFSAASAAAAVAQWALNVAMNANPLMLVATALAAVVAGLVWFFTQTETGRQAWQSFTDFLGASIESIKAWFGSAGDWIMAKWDALVAWFQAVPGRITGFFQGIGQWFSNKFNEAKDGISNAFDSAAGFVSSIPGRITGFFGSIGGWFRDKFNEVKDGIQSGFNSAVDFVRSIPDRILGALGNVGNLLYDAGASILDGFLRGLKSIWDNVTGFVGNIAGWIRDHKGPISYDKKLLIPAGRAIMGGFGKALNAGFADVQADVLAMNGTLADSFAPTRLGGTDWGKAGRLNVVDSDPSSYAGRRGRPGGVEQNFNIKVVRSDADLYSASSIIYRNAVREARSVRA